MNDAGQQGPAHGSRRVGLLGGTFDPMNTAHVALAHAALTGLQLDEVRWVPAGRPWQKGEITDAVHREAMVRLAIDGETRFTVDRIEIERQGASYTLDTVRALQQREPGTEWVLIIGQDQYAGLHTWGNWPELLARVTLAVANRPGVPAAVHPDVLAYPHRAVPLAMLDISSTDIRARVAAGQDISQLVPPQVARYIDKHQLYKG